MKYRDTSGVWREIPTAKGDEGFSPIITVKQNTSSIYKLEITTKDGTIITPNLRGAGGGIDAIIVDTLPTGEDINVGLIYLTLVEGTTYQANMYRDGKWINFGGATTDIVQKVITDPLFEQKVINVINDEIGASPISDIERLFENTP